MFKKFRAMVSVVLILILGMCVIPTTAEALFDAEKGWLPEKPENAPEFGTSMSFLTKYIWRGWNLGDEPVMQTDMYLSWYGFTFDWWTNYSLNDEKGRDGGRYQEFTEIDYTIDYTFNVGEAMDFFNIEGPDFLDPLSISGGYIYYTFPNVDWDDKYFDTQEVYLSASYDCFLQPSFTWYWDVDHGKGNSDGGGNGSYFLFGIGHTFEFDGGITSNVGMTWGINNEQWTDKTGLADMVISGDVTIPLFNYFYVTPSIAYSVIMDRDTYNDGAESEFYGGITFGFTY